MFSLRCHRVHPTNHLLRHPPTRFARYFSYRRLVICYVHRNRLFVCLCVRVREGVCVIILLPCASGFLFLLLCHRRRHLSGMAALFRVCVRKRKEKRWKKRGALALISTLLFSKRIRLRHFSSLTHTNTRLFQIDVVCRFRTERELQTVRPPFYFFNITWRAR